MFLTLKLTNLRNSEFVQYFQHFDQLLLKFDTAALGIQAVYNPLQTNTQKVTVLYKQKMGSDISEDMVNVDKRRDEAINGIVAVTRAFKYSHDENIRTAATDLLDSIEFYGDNISRMNYAAETSTINDLVNKWRTEEKLVNALKTINQEGWLTELDEANKAFDSLFMSRIDESATNPEISFRAIRIEMGEQFTTFLKHLEAFSIVNGAEAYKPLIDRINALIEEYDRMLDMRKARSSANSQVEASESVNNIE